MTVGGIIVGFSHRLLSLETRVVVTSPGLLLKRTMNSWTCCVVRGGDRTSWAHPMDLCVSTELTVPGNSMNANQTTLIMK